MFSAYIVYTNGAFVRAVSRDRESRQISNYRREEGFVCVFLLLGMQVCRSFQS